MALKEIGDGIATRLKTIRGLRVFATKDLPDTPNEFPCALIMPGETEYVTTLSSNDADYNFRIILLFSKQDTPSAVKEMLPYMGVEGSKSIVAAIDGDTTLDGAAEDTKVTRNLGIGNTLWGGVTYLSTEFLAQVWAQD